MNEESVYRILSVCEAGSDEIPENLQVNTSNTDLHQQVVKVNIFSFTNNFAHPPSPLRQRSVSRVEEIVQTKLVRYISNSDILSICFVFHPEKNRSGEYNCLGMQSCYLCWYCAVTNAREEVSFEEVSSESFVSFARDFSQHKVDYNYEIWHSMATVRTQINRLMCKSTLGQGISFIPEKNLPFHVSLHLWPYLVLYLKGKCMSVHAYERKS